jgi:hypothetical protein
MWEDPENEEGGKWTITPPQKDHRELNYYWTNTVLAIIGGSLLGEGTTDHEICGAVLSRRVNLFLSFFLKLFTHRGHIHQRQGDRITVWNKNKNLPVLPALNARIRAIVGEGGWPASLSISYTPHTASLQKVSCFKAGMWSQRCPHFFCLRSI